MRKEHRYVWVYPMLAVLAGGIAALFMFPQGPPPEEVKPLEPENVIPLRIDAVPRKVSGYPIQLGVPFLPGEMERLNVCVLKDGKAIPSEATELVRWGGKASGVKFALIRFLADLDVRPTSGYAVAFGPSAPAPGAPELDVSKTDGKISVDTGAVSFVVSEAPLVFFSDVRLRGKLLLRESRLQVIDADGRAFSKLKDGKVEIEHKGALCAVIKITGSFDDPAAGGLGVLTRITVYAGKPTAKLDYTLVQNASTPVLELKGWKLGLTPVSKFSLYEIGGEERDCEGSVPDAGARLLQDGEMTPKDGSLRVVATRMKYAGVGEGKRAPGWAKATSSDGAVLVAIRRFWQQYPKSIEVKPDALDLWLQAPESHNTFRPLVAGWAKTHEILLHFDPQGEADPAASREAFQQGVRATVPAERYRACGVFGDYSLPSPASRDYDFVTTTFLDYSRYTHIVHFAFQGTGRWWMEGNLNFGNRMVWNFFMNNTRDSAGRLFTHSLRLLGAYPHHSRYAFDLAEAQARCSMDLHVMHADPGEGRYAGYGPGMIFGHSGNHAASRVLRDYPGHRRYSYYSEPLDLHRSNTRWGPMIHPAGLMEYYLLTGETRAREVLCEIADWAVALQKKGGEEYEHYIRSADGPAGLYLWTLMSAYEATGKDEYLDALYAAAPLLKQVFEENGGSLAGRSKGPMRTGALLTCLIRLLEFDERIGRLDRVEATRWIVGTVEDFHKIIRRREGWAGFPSRCSGEKQMMFHAFGFVASLPDAPAWAKEDFRDLVRIPAFEATTPDEERFEYIRPGGRDGQITVCSTIEEGFEMLFFSSAEVMALHEKVFGEEGLPARDDPMNAWYAEYQRACREDPDSFIALDPEPPEPDEMGDFQRTPVCKIRFAEPPPTVDGDPGDACWTQASLLKDFTLESDSGKSKLDTTVKLAWDRENLYLLMVAPDLKPPKQPQARDRRQWQEDGIEIFLDTNFDRTSYWKIVVNLQGETDDQYYVQPFLAVSDWDPELRVGRKPGVIEIAIPFKSFDCRWDVEGPVSPKGRWSANFCRTGDGSSWVGYNMALTAHIPQGFGVLEFSPAPREGD